MYVNTERENPNGKRTFVGPLPIVTGKVKSKKNQSRRFFHDGNGLYLQVMDTGSVSWIFRYRSPTTGREYPYKGLGPARDVELGGRTPRKPLGCARMVRGREKIRATRKKGGQEWTDLSQSLRRDGRTQRQRKRRRRRSLELHAFPLIGDILIVDLDFGGDQLRQPSLTSSRNCTRNNKYEAARKLQQRMNSGHG